MKLSGSQKHVITALLIVVFIILIGAFFYHGQESLDWVDSFYLTIMNVLTIGVNGFAPSSDTTKTFTMIYTLVSVPTLIFCLGIIVEDRFEARVHRVEERRERRENK